MRLTNVLTCAGKFIVGKYTKDYANLPERYIKRKMRQIYWKTPNAVNYRQVTVERNKFNFGMHRPWSSEFEQENVAYKPFKRVYVEPIKEWSFFRGDRVEVLVGKDKGKQGIINYIVQERNWVIVEGLNCEYKNVGEQGEFPGMLLKTEKPLLVTTEVALVDPSDKKPTKVDWRFTEDGSKVRVSVRTGRLIPIPVKAEETVDYKTKSTYNERSKDTVTDEITKITFEPKVATFEMDIMETMGIKEDRIPHKTYWY